MLPMSLLGRPRLHEVGMVKLGGKDYDNPKTTREGRTWYPPTRFSHMVLTKRIREEGPNPRESGDYEPDWEVMASLGHGPGKLTDCPMGGFDAKGSPVAKGGTCNGLPKEIPIFLPFAGLHDDFYTRLAYYAGRSLVCMNDRGSYIDEATKKEVFYPATRFAKRDGGQVVQVKEGFDFPCPCPLLDEGKCKMWGVLRFQIANEHASLGGFYALRTTSKNSIRNITFSIARFLTEVGPALPRLPLTLRGEVETLRTPDSKETEALVVWLDFRGTAADFVAKAIEVRKDQVEKQRLIGVLAQDEQRLLLTTSRSIEEALSAQVNEEFSPDTVDSTPEAALDTAKKPVPPAPGESDQKRVGRRKRAETIDAQASSRPVAPAEKPITDPGPASTTPPLESDAALEERLDAIGLTDDTGHSPEEQAENARKAAEAAKAAAPGPDVSALKKPAAPPVKPATGPQKTLAFDGLV